jgi:hypothetical protein
MQPTYLPWLGYFALMQSVDHFVYLNDVQLEKQSWQTRNRIKTPDGPIWLSVQKHATLDTTIDDTTLVNKDKWVDKHLKSIRQYYSNAEHFNEVFPVIESLLHNNAGNLSGYNIAIIEGIARRLGIQSKRYKASKLKIGGEKTERIIKICQYLGCDTYISPNGSADYLDEQEFTDCGITLQYQNYEHPVYNQLHGEFVSHLSIIDYVMNEGFSLKKQEKTGWKGTKKEDFQRVKAETLTEGQKAV